MKWIDNDGCLGRQHRENNRELCIRRQIINIPRSHICY